MDRRNRGNVVIAGDVVVAVEGDAHHGNDAENAGGEAAELHGGTDDGVRREGGGDDAGGDQDGEDGHDGDVLEGVHCCRSERGGSTTAQHAEREDEEQADAPHHDGAVLQQSDRGEQEGERVQEEVADDHEVGDARAARVQKHDERNHHAARVAEDALRLRTLRKHHLAHFFVCVFFGEAAASSDDDLRKAGDGTDCHQNQNSRNQGTLPLS